MTRSEQHKMRGVRPPAVAGLFYPDGARPLRRMVEGMLAEAEPTENGGDPPKAVIAPHAGYVYSGPVAATAFEPLRSLAGHVDRIVVLGPSHHVPFRGLALPEAECFETPFGRVEIDLEAADALLDLEQVRVDATPHLKEHALEVELPFLQAVLGTFRIVPLVVGSAPPAEVAEVLERVWGGSETLVVLSSDLSHFLDYETARRVDRETADEITELDARLTPRQACGAAAVNGFLHLAQQRGGVGARLLDLRNSGDTAGPRDQVVGYGAFTFNAVNEANGD